MTARSGAVSLPELLLVFWLFGFVLAAVAGFAGAQGRLSAVQHQRERAGEVTRTATVVLRQELRHSLGAQLVAAAGDSLRVRAARGSGGICAAAGRDLTVRYRGVRRPEPAKDSVLILTAGAVEVAGGIESVADAGECPDALLIRLESPPASTAGLVVVYEGGTYLLASGALRYRRGRAGRQPLTEALLRSTSYLDLAAQGLVLGLDYRPDSLSHAPSFAARRTLAILNRRPAP